MSRQNYKPSPKAAVVKFHPDHLVEAEYAGGEHFKEFVVVHVGGPGLRPESFTIHRPLGVTHLDTSDWVATRTTDVHFLMSGIKDPDHEKYERIRKKITNEFYIEKSLLLGTLDDPLYPEEISGEKKRNLRLQECERLMKEDMAKSRKEHDERQVGKPKAAKFGYAKTKYDFMPPDMKAYEKRLKEEAARDAKFKEKVKDSSSTYTTRGGPDQNEPQRPIPFLKGKSVENASVLVYKGIKDLFAKAADPDGSASPTPPAPVMGVGGSASVTSSSNTSKFPDKDITSLLEKLSAIDITVKGGATALKEIQAEAKAMLATASTV